MSPSCSFRPGEAMSNRFLRKSAFLHDLRLSTPLEVRSAPTNSGIIEGYASTFGGPPDAYGHIIEVGAFTQSLSALRRDGQSIPMLWAHDQKRPIGRWIELREDARGLFARGQLNLETQGGREAQAHTVAGDVTGLSIGFSVPRDGVRREGAITFLTDIRLGEISVVAVPANGRARITGTKSLASKSDLVDLLRETGLAKDAARRVAAGGWPALAGETTNPVDWSAMTRAVKAATDRMKKAIP